VGGRKEFIANARQDIPWLINEVYRLRKRDSQKEGGKGFKVWRVKTCNCDL